MTSEILILMLALQSILILSDENKREEKKLRWKDKKLKQKEEPKIRMARGRQATCDHLDIRVRASNSLVPRTGNYGNQLFDAP